MTIKWLKSKAIFAHLDNICLLHNLFEERNFSITRKFGKVVPEKTLKKKKQNETKTSEIGSVNILASFYVAFWVSIIIRACVMKENHRTWMIYQGLSSHISDRYRNGGPEQLTNFRAHRASSSRARGRGQAGPASACPVSPTPASRGPPRAFLSHFVPVASVIGSMCRSPCPLDSLPRLCCLWYAKAPLQCYTHSKKSPRNTKVWERRSPEH